MDINNNKRTVLSNQACTQGIGLQRRKSREYVEKKKKTPAPDGISNEIINLVSNIRPDLLGITKNCCLRLYNLPTLRKRQFLVLLRKPGKTLDSVFSYRAVCLLDNVSKHCGIQLLARLEREI